MAKKSHIEVRSGGHGSGKTLCGREGGFVWDGETCEACVRVQRAREAKAERQAIRKDGGPDR